MPLNRYAEDEETTEEEICKGCRFYPTKPEAVPREIGFFVSAALEFSEIESSGGRYAYPDALPPIDWATMEGLARGRNRANSLQGDRERKDKRKKERNKTRQRTDG